MFITEARKSDGEQYPPKTLYQILCGVLRSMRNSDPFSQTRTQHPTGVNLQSIFNAGSGTLNISPQGNFVVNIHCAGVRSEFDEFDTLVEDANLDL